MDGSYWQRLGRRGMRRRELLGRGIAAGAGLATGMLVACGGGKKSSSSGGAATSPGGASTTAGKPGGTLTHNLNDNPPSLNLWTEFTYLVPSAIAPVFNQLLQLDPLDESKVVADLAKSWEYTTPDKTELVFKLQDANISFHDGKPFSAEDVKATYDWLRSPPKGVTSQRTTGARNIDSVEIPDPKTVRFHLKSPGASFLSGICNHAYAMGAKHIVDQTNTLLDAQQRPTGTGPFVFKDWKRDNVIEMERNKSYWRPNRPYLDGVQLYIIQENTTAVTNFLSGQLLFLSNFQASDIPQIQKGLGNKGTIHSAPGLAKAAVIPNGTRPPFNDPRMREALSAAVDRNQFNQVISEGRGVLGSYLNPQGPWALPQADFIKFTGYDGRANIQKAKQLMAAAGYADGFKGRMPVRQDFERHGVTVQAMLKQAGFDFSIDVQKSAVYTDRILTPDWDITTHVWSIPADDPDDSFAEMLISPDRAGRNWAKITIPEVDRLFDQQRVEFDVEKRKQLVHEADKAALGQYPNMILAYGPDLAAWQVALKDYKPHISPYTNQRFENAWLAQ